ncbi:MAG: hypothetical protein ACRDVC_00375 [Acidimicrobiales bacterium]
MLSMLAVVVILGVVVTIVLSTGPSSLKSTTTGGTAAGTTTTTVKSIGTEAKAAAVSSCLGNYSIVNTALGYYKTLEGSLPPAGTAWATSSSNGGTLESWPTDAPYYTITWNGVTLSVIPKHGTSSRGTAGTRAPPTGCYGA